MYINDWGTPSYWEIFFEDFTTERTDFQFTVNNASSEDKIGLYWMNYNNSDWILLENVKFTQVIVDCSDNDYINWIPTEVVNIWRKWYINLFWMIDWEWNYWPEKPSDHEFSSTATVGSITPWNYTWYLTIKWADWKTYKVWVYNV